MVGGVVLISVVHWNRSTEINYLLGAQQWAAWIISYWLVKWQVKFNIIMITLLFEPSTFIHLKQTFKYRWYNTIFHLYQTQFNHSSKPVCILVKYNWGQRVCSHFSKGWLFSTLSHESLSLSFCFLACIFYDILVISTA